MDHDLDEQTLKLVGTINEGLNVHCGLYGGVPRIQASRARPDELP